MYTNILLCYDGSAEGRSALREGAHVAAALKAKAHLLAICRDFVSGAIPEAMTPALINCQEDTARVLLEEGVRKLQELGVSAEGTLVFGDPVIEIPKAARELNADLVIVGHQKRGRLARWWSDSQEQTLLDLLSCSILVAVKPSRE